MSEVAPLISDLAVILIAAGVVTVLFKWLKQPVVLGYIVAGILAGPAVPFLPTVADTANIKIWADIGVIFLLFAMGLEFSFRKLMSVGSTAVVAAVVIVSGMMFLGYTAGNLMGFSHITSIFLGGMLSMSSTAVVFKSFDDLGLREQKFAGVVLGVLVVEDLVAVVLMVLLSTLAIGKEFEGMAMLESVGKLVLFLVFWSVLGIYLVPTLLKRVKRYLNGETLLVVALAFCLGMVMLATKAGFSAALGAFVMGSLLAETTESASIEKLVQPVKDLFGAIFFVSVGMMVEPAMLWEYLGPILLLVCLVLAGQVFFGTLGVVLAGQPLKVAVQSGFSLTQVGEFAFIIASLGESLKVTDGYLYPVIVAVSVITIFLTPYMMRLAGPATGFVERHLPESLRLFLARYASGSNTVRHKSAWRRLLRSMLLSVGLYFILSVFLLTAFSHYVVPFIMERVDGWQGGLLCLAVMLAAIGPLLWAIVMAKNHSPEFQQLWRDNKFNRGPLVSIMVVKALLCLGILMTMVVRLFNVASGVGMVISVVLLFAVIFSKWLRKRFFALRAQFMENLNGESGGRGEVGDMLAASPFADLHLADFVISANSPLVGKTLKEARFRQEYGVNIVAFTRGEERVNIPGGDTVLSAFDKITVVGTDEEIEACRARMSRQESERHRELAAREEPKVRIEQFIVEAGSPLAGMTIREVDFQDRMTCMIIGIERGREPVMNPPADFVFAEGDVVWVVGETHSILQLSVGQHLYPSKGEA